MFGRFLKSVFIQRPKVTQSTMSETDELDFDQDLLPKLAHMTQGVMTGVFVMLSVMGLGVNSLLLHILLAKRSAPTSAGSIARWKNLSHLELHLLAQCVLEILVCAVQIPAMEATTMMKLLVDVPENVDMAAKEYMSWARQVIVVCHLSEAAKIMFMMVRTLLLEAVSVERYLSVKGQMPFHTKWVVFVLGVAYVLGGGLMTTQMTQADTVLTVRLCHHWQSDLQNKETVAIASAYFRLAVIMQALVVSLTMGGLTVRHLYRRGEVHDLYKFLACRRFRRSSRVRSASVYGEQTCYTTSGNANHRRLSEELHDAASTQSKTCNAEARLAGPVLAYSLFTLTLTAVTQVLIPVLQTHQPGSFWMDFIACLRVMSCLIFPVYVCATIPGIRAEVVLLLRLTQPCRS